MPTRAHISPRRIPAAFTLIELLVVIAIIVILVSVLLPCLSRAKLLTRKVVCQANLNALGKSAALYQMDNGDYVPMCWENFPPQTHANPYMSWRASLLPYAVVGLFNCPSAGQNGSTGELLHSNSEVTAHDPSNNYTMFAGSYGVIDQLSLPTFETPNDAGYVMRGSPEYSQAFSTRPSKAWRDPANSVYLADSFLAMGPIVYPSTGHKNYGAAAVKAPCKDPGDADWYFITAKPMWRFADRHDGTSCLFLGGYVRGYKTSDLENMTAGDPECVWDTQ